MKKSIVFEWHEWFKEGCENMEDDESSCHPVSHRTDENAVEVWNPMHLVNQAFYVEILKQLCKAVHRKRPELWPSDWILHHDSAPAHKVLSVKQFWAQKLITELENPPTHPSPQI
jgi:hypothetical protein